MYRDLLVHVDGSKAGRRRVDFAAELANRLGARLTGLHVTPPPEVPPRFKPSLVGAVADDISAHLALDAQAAGDAFKVALTCLPDASWVEAAGDVADGISARARYADLVVLGQYEWQGPSEVHPLPIAHTVVMRCGRPVLVVPAAIAAGYVLSKVAIAWDGSREAVRAVHDALPLLRMAHVVEVMTMIGRSVKPDDFDAKSLSAHLANHGIKATGDAVRVVTDDEPATLQDRIDGGKYHLLVMGAYSRPRWEEFIFGGATRSILLSSKIPILISH
ncbi:universal stress protein [Rhizobium jaguaris]|uniref:universal stress protein n=1 Tax=Rhizobium jaguaris TaxID=1312183 RepID=UPI0039BFFF95